MITKEQVLQWAHETDMSLLSYHEEIDVIGCGPEELQAFAQLAFNAGAKSAAGEPVADTGNPITEPVAWVELDWWKRGTTADLCFTRSKSSDSDVPVYITPYAFAVNEPVACPNGEPFKHGNWCTEDYCQGIPGFRNQYTPPAEKREPLTTAAVAHQCRKHKWIDATSFEDAYFVGFRDAEAAHGIGVKK